VYSEVANDPYERGTVCDQALEGPLLKVLWQSDIHCPSIAVGFGKRFEQAIINHCLSAGAGFLRWLENGH
jgi:hypothetical protein